MTQQNKNGMRLRPAPNPGKKDTIWMIQMIAAMMASVVLVLSMTGLAGFSAGNTQTVILAVSVWMALLYGVLLKIKQESWFYTGVLVIALVMILVCREQILEGYRIFWNQLSDAMVQGTGIVLPEWKHQFLPEERELCAMLFAGFAGGIISLICCTLISFAPVLLAVLLPAAVLGGMVLLGVDTRFLWMLPVLGVSVLILMYSSWRQKGSASPVVMSWIVGGAAAAILIAGTSLPGIQNWARELSDGVHQSFHEDKYETRYTTLPEGDFSDFSISDRAGQPGLRVTMEKPQLLYLRGFTGAVFTGESWEPLDRAALAKNKDLLYWLNLNAFDQHAQFDAAAAYAGMEQSTVTVQNIGACSYYRYVPFSIGKGDWTEPENLNTDGVHGDGERTYVYSVTAGTASDVMEVLTHLQTSQDPAVLQYRKAESGYRQFIYHYYLQIPEDVKQQLGDLWNGIADQYGSADNLTLQQAQDCTLMFLSHCFPEDGPPEDLELPLGVAEGTTFQYATVAAMTLRYYGIPARYAEGYVISAQMAAGVESGEIIMVDSGSAKAWVEVYQDGIGWIPMDLTPGMGEVLNNQGEGKESPDKTQDGANGKGDGTTGDGSFMQEYEPPETEPEETPPEDSENSESNNSSILLKKLLFAVLMVLLILLLIFLILALRRIILVKRREKKFGNENCSDAVAWIYGDTSILLEQLGFARGNGSMRTLRQPLEEKFGPEFAVQFDLASDLNDRAMFSSQPLEEESRKMAQKFHSWVLRKLKSEVKWYRRLWLKWVRCLY